MGLMNMLRGQAVDVIEWTENVPDILVYKYGSGSKQIMSGAQLTVKEGQTAVFVNEGQLADVFQPGRYTLDTANLPMLTRLQAWRYGFNSPFKAELFFISSRRFMDRKWGTANPVMMRDPELGTIRVRAFGSYAFRVSDPAVLLRQCIGSAPMLKVSELDGQIKRIAVSALSDVVAESHIAAADLAANYDELGSMALERINPRLEQLGVMLTDFVVENISLQEEAPARPSPAVPVQTPVYTAPVQAAKAPVYTAAQAAPVSGQMAFCPKCRTQLIPGARFCAGCGSRVNTAPVCPGCGKAVASGARFCADCGTKLG